MIEQNGSLFEGSDMFVSFIGVSFGSLAEARAVEFR